MEGFTSEQREKLKRLREKGKSRTGAGRTMKAVVDAMDQDARRQGLSRLPKREGWQPGENGLGPPSKFPSTFGNGSS